MKRIIFISISLLVITASSFIVKMKCFSDYDKKTDFSKYKSFAWIAPYDTVISMHRKDKPYGNYIIKVCDAELVKKGMVLDSVNPDVVFMFDTQIKESDIYKQAPTTSVGVSVYAPAYYGQNYYGGPAFDPNGYNMGAKTPGTAYPPNSTGYWGGYYYGAGVSKQISGGEVTKHHVEEGSLIINMYDAKTRKFIWGGGAEEAMDITTDVPIEINLAVESIFKLLPIKKK